MGYAEINTTEHGSWFDEGKLSKVYKDKVDRKFKIGEIKTKEDIWPLFARFFGGRVK